MVKVSVSPEITHDSVAVHLKGSIEGTLELFNDQTLSEISDVAKIKKVYKLGALPSPGAKTNSSQVNGASDNDVKRQLELSLLGAIALRSS